MRHISNLAAQKDKGFSLQHAVSFAELFEK